LVGLGLSGVFLGMYLFWVGFNAPNNIPGRSYYTLHAQFANADNLTSHYQVRVGGRLIGQVLNPRVSNGLAVVDLQLTPAIKPLLSDTKLKVRPRSPIGVRYVDVLPGTRGTPLKDGALISASQTSATVTLDQVLGALNTTARAGTRTFLNELGVGFAGRGEDLGGAITAAPQFLGDTTTVTAAINARTGAAARLIRATEGAAAAADPVRQQIAAGFDPEARAMRPFSVHGDSLRAALDVAPGALATVRAGLIQTDPLLVEVDGLAVNARPALRVAPGALTETTALLRESRPSFAALNGTLKLAGRAVHPTLRLLRTISPVLPSVEAALRGGLPILAELAPRGCDIKLMLSNWESMLAFGNEGGNFLRFNLVGGSQESAGIGHVTTGVHQNPYPAPCVAGIEKVGR
jgi:virulence factor Mce-like protein